MKLCQFYERRGRHAQLQITITHEILSQCINTMYTIKTPADNKSIPVTK